VNGRLSWMSIPVTVVVDDIDRHAGAIEQYKRLDESTNYARPPNRPLTIFDGAQENSSSSSAVVWLFVILAGLTLVFLALAFLILRRARFTRRKSRAAATGGNDGIARIDVGIASASNRCVESSDVVDFDSAVIHTASPPEEPVVHAASGPAIIPMAPAPLLHSISGPAPELHSTSRASNIIPMAPAPELHSTSEAAIILMAPAPLLHSISGAPTFPMAAAPELHLTSGASTISMAPALVIHSTSGAAIIPMAPAPVLHATSEEHIIAMAPSPVIHSTSGAAILFTSSGEEIF
jgi:hypothetical protein